MTVPQTAAADAGVPDSSLSADADGVLEALARLGDTPDEIAVELARLGCRGQVGICVTCPLAHYLERLPDLDYTDPDAGYAIEVLTDSVIVRFAAAGTVSVPLPAAVAEFAERFDYGAYPQLAA